MEKRWQEINGKADAFLRRLLYRIEHEEPVSPEWYDALNHQRAFDYRQAYGRLLRHKRLRRIRRWSVAVAIVVSLSGGWSLLWMKGKPTVPEAVPVAKAADILPGGKKAVLTLADGTVWNLQDSSMVLGNATPQLRVDSLGLCVLGDSLTDTQAWNTLAIPRGGEFYLTLPDGTQVWLNSETTLRFPARFAPGNREVELAGEAYFDVVRDRHAPFVVRTQVGEVCVLGTEFGISAYAEENMSATLVEGSIRFDANDGNSAVVCPEQRLTYDAEEGTITLEKVDTWIYTSWREQVFCFENRRLEEILTVLARWYNVEVSYESEALKALKLSGTMDKYKEIRPFLQIFETGTDVKFEIRDRKIIVKRKSVHLID